MEDEEVEEEVDDRCKGDIKCTGRKKRGGGQSVAATGMSGRREVRKERTDLPNLQPCS